MKFLSTYIAIIKLTCILFYSLFISANIYRSIVNKNKDLWSGESYDLRSYS